MKLDIKKVEKNTQTVQFRIDPKTNRLLTGLRNYYGVSNGRLIKQMIKQSYKAIFPNGEE